MVWDRWKEVLGGIWGTWEKKKGGNGVLQELKIQPILTSKGLAGTEEQHWWVAQESTGREW